MEKDTSNMIKRAERFQMLLIGEGLVVGGIAGLVIVLYRMILECAGHWLNQILAFSASDCRVVSGADLTGMACRQAGEIRTDDLWQRDSAA